MAIFTGTPVLISDIQINTINNFTGRFYFGGFEWLVGVDKITGEDVVVKRTGAATWVTFNSGQSTVFPQPVLDTANGEIVIVGVASSTLKTHSFNLTSETFSSLTTSSFAAGFEAVSAIRPNGDVRAFFQGVGGAVFAVSVTAGAFGTPITLEAGTNKVPRGVVCDSSGVFHIAYSHGATFKYVTLDASDAAGTPATIAAATTITDLANSRIFDDRIIFSNSYNDPVRIFIGTPISAPVWSVLSLHSATAGINDFSMSVVEQGGILKFLYEHTDFSTVSEIMQVTWDGTTLGTPEVFWDALANPPGAGVPPYYLSRGLTADFGSTLGVAVSSWDDNFDIYTVFLEIAGARINRMY